MGSPADEPDRDGDEGQVSVTLRGFWMGKHEVTQSEWHAVMGTTIQQQSEQSSLYGVGPRRPMYYVSYAEATTFCEQLTAQERAAGRLPSGWEYRLPTEAQWEYACRAGTKTATSFGTGLSSSQANFNRNNDFSVPRQGATVDVASYAGNGWGLRDMHGNVGEWCRDWFVERLPGGTDPEVSSEAWERVVRGGTWRSPQQGCRSAHRGGCQPGFRYYAVGFRVAAVRASR